MPSEFDDRWYVIQARLKESLDALDQREEHLIAVYVATALDHMEARQRDPRARPA